MLIERWSPVTHDMGLIEAPLQRIASAFLEWQDGLGVPHDTRSVTAGLADAFEALLPLSAGKRRRLFVQTKSGWTAQFQSGIQGSDPFPVMSLFAGWLGVDAMRVCSTPASETYATTIWEVYAPGHRGGGELNNRRSVCAMNDDGKWIFEESGEPYAFEDLASYSKPRKRERFTRSLLERYLAEFGLFPFRDDFYLVDSDTPALLLERRSRWEKEPPEFSLEAVKRGEPWARS